MKQSMKQKYSKFVQGIQKVARSDWSHSWIGLASSSDIGHKSCTWNVPAPFRRPGPFQHRRSGHLCRTACYSLPEKFRSNLYAVKRHNMSTVTLQEPAFHRSRLGGCQLVIVSSCQSEWHILYILYISHISHVAENIFCIFCIVCIYITEKIILKPGGGNAVSPGLRWQIFEIFEF